MATTWTDDSIEIGATAPVAVRGDAKRQRGGTPPLVLHLHAGAFVGGTLESGQLVASLLADAGAVVVSADYPLAPVHIFPGALRGCEIADFRRRRGSWRQSRGRPRAACARSPSGTARRADPDLADARS